MDLGSRDYDFEFQQAHRRQLLANMIKTSADIAFDRLSEGTLIEEITVYGLVVNYNGPDIPLMIKMNVNYSKRKTTLLEARNNSLTIPEVRMYYNTFHLLFVSQ